MAWAAAGAASAFAVTPSASRVEQTRPAVAHNSAGLSLPADFYAKVYAKGLNLPTAMAFGPGGKLYVSQIAGGENQGVGEIAVLDHPGASPKVLQRGLTKPTGLAWRKKTLYIAAGRDILRTRLGPDGNLEKPVTVVHDLPDNGRSEGQIDVLPDGRLLFEASGNVAHAHASGMLFTMAAGQKPRILATGLKNAYAHAYDPKSGQLYTTDIEDNRVNGKAAPDEINAVQSGGDYGWPGCYANQRPAFNYGGSKRACGKTSPPLINLPAHATPTGLAYYRGGDFPKKYRGVLYAALFNGRPPRVIRITLARRGGHAAGRATAFITGRKFLPIDVLPDPRGGLLVLDFAAGAIYRVSGPS